MEPQASAVLVAFETSADPSKLRRKLVKRWRKSYGNCLKKRQQKEKLASLQTVLQKALQEHGPTVTMGELRAMVGQTLGITLEGKNKVPFDNT